MFFDSPSAAAKRLSSTSCRDEGNGSPPPRWHRRSRCFLASWRCPASGWLTVSIGIVTYPADGRSADQPCADAAVYAAKVKAKSDPSVRDNRRSHSRVEASIEDSCWLAVDNTAFRTKDLSEGGMLIEMEQEVLLGALGNFELNLPDGHRRWGVGQIGRGFRRAAAASKSASNFSPRY